MALTLPQGFDVQNPEALETKTVQETVADRDNISLATRYEGLKVYVKQLQKNFQLVGGITNAHWVDFGDGAGGGGTWGSIIGTLSDQTDLQDEFDAKINSDGTNSNIGSIEFDAAYVKTGLEPTGSLNWNSDEDTLDIVLSNGVVLQAGQEQFYPVINQTGSTLYNGKVAAFAGTDSNSGKIKIQYGIADYAQFAARYNLGIITEDIANGLTGKVTYFGKVRSIQTDGANYGETWLDGDILFVSPSTPGALTNIMPNAPYPAIYIAVVINAHSSNGTIFVRPTFPERLRDLADIDGTPLATYGQIPVYQGTGDGGDVFDFTHNIEDYLLKTHAFFDATVGTGGDYATIALAIAAGKYKLKLVSDIPDYGSMITINDKVYIYLNNYSITITAAIYYVSSGKYLEIYGGTIILSGLLAPHIVAINAEDLYIYNSIITCNQTASNSGICYTGRLYNCVFNVNTGYSATAFGSSVGGKIDARNITLNVNTSSAYYCLALGNGSTLYNLILGGTAPTNSNGVMYLAPTDLNLPAKIENIILIVNYTVYISVRTGIISNMRKTTGTLNFKQHDGGGTGTANCLIKDSYIDNIVNQSGFVGGNYKYEHCVINNNWANTLATIQLFKCTLNGTFSSTSSYNISDTCYFASTYQNTGDYCKIEKNTIVGVLTLNSGSENNVIEGNTLTAGLTLNSGALSNRIIGNVGVITDSSGSTTNIIRDSS